MKLTVLILPTVDDGNTERYHYAAIEQRYFVDLLAKMHEAYDLANMSGADIHSVSSHVQSDRFIIYSSLDINRKDYDELHTNRFVTINQDELKGVKIAEVGGMVHVYHTAFSVNIAYNYQDKTHGYNTMPVGYSPVHI